MDEQSQFSNIGGPSVTKTSRRPKMLVFVVLFLILLGVSIYIGSRFLGKKEGIEGQVPTPTITLAPSATPTPTKEVTPTAAKATPKPTAKATPTSGTGKASLMISVQNGSGVKGAAASMAATLKDAGYTVSSTGNADNFDYEGVTIKVKSTKSSFLNKLKTDLSGDYTVANATADLPASEETDVLIIVGK